MKIEKAIEVLKMDNELMQFDPNTGEDYPIELQNEINQDIYKANLAAISALEKQIPKKPTHHKETDDEYEHYKCTNCKIVLDSTTRYMEYDCCPDCGQKLDWEEEDE